MFGPNFKTLKHHLICLQLERQPKNEIYLSQKLHSNLDKLPLDEICNPWQTAVSDK